MAVSSESGVFFNDSRRAVRFLNAGVQLRLPVYVLAITLLFGAALVWHSHAAYADLFAMVATYAPDSSVQLVREQTQDFMAFSGILLAAYALAVLAFCLVYTHRIIGPTVALRRQVQALKNGNYRPRVHLRRGDQLFEELANELNELTQILGGPRQ